MSLSMAKHCLYWEWDPKNPSLLKPFSAANITIMGEDDCYIYVVLEGSQFTETADMIEGSYILRGSLMFIGVILLIGLAIGFFIFQNAYTSFGCY